MKFESRVRSVSDYHPVPTLLEVCRRPADGRWMPATTHMSCPGGFQSRWPLEAADYLSAWSTAGSSCGAAILETVVQIARELGMALPSNKTVLGLVLRKPAPNTCLVLVA
jgi:hypothetical protein